MSVGFRIPGNLQPTNHASTTSPSRGTMADGSQALETIAACCFGISVRRTCFVQGMLLLGLWEMYWRLISQLRISICIVEERMMLFRSMMFRRCGRLVVLVLVRGVGRLPLNGTEITMIASERLHAIHTKTRYLSALAKTGNSYCTTAVLEAE